MSRSRTSKLIAGLGLPATVLALLVACSTDSPTAPQQQPAPPPGPPSAIWTLNVTVSPDDLPAESATPATVSIDVRRADTGVAPASGTTIVVSTSLGEFDTLGSGLSSIALGTVNGRAQTLLFPGSIIGTALVTAQLESSAGQDTLRVSAGLPDLVAAFSFENSTDNLSFQFVNESVGNPTSYFWSFGDGETSTEKHPVHVYAIPGDYVVELTVFRGEESSQVVDAIRAIQDVFITSVSPTVVTEGGRLRIQGQGFDNAVRVLINGLLADLITKSSTLLVIDLPVGFVFTTEQCDFNGDGTKDDGIIEIPLTTVNIGVEVSGGIGTDSVDVALTLKPTIETCQQDPEFEPVDEFFITAVVPNSGPESGGTVVTISGTGFASPLRVSFGGVLATTISVSSTQVVVSSPLFDVPPGSECVPVNVEIELGNGAVGSVSGGFTYVETGASCT